MVNYTDSYTDNYAASYTSQIGIHYDENGYPHSELGFSENPALTAERTQATMP